MGSKAVESESQHPIADRQPVNAVADRKMLLMSMPQHLQKAAVQLRATS